VGSAPDSTYIVNGVDVSSVDKYPWIVGLYFNGNSLPFCGGVLLNTNTVLTAGHCTVGQSASNIQVVAHRLDLRQSPQSENAAIFNVVSLRTHPGFDSSNGWSIRNDIGILKVSLVSGVAPTNQIILDRGGLTSPGTYLVTAGWGRTSFNGPQSPILKETTVPITTNDVCYSAYPPLQSNPTSFCAGYDDGHTDACNGDSGGPLFQPQGNSAVLVGLVSSGFECARPNKPGVYTKISSLLNWI
ncbi:trypsin-like cysteine/serine peptidase domain-containing protein, partial [Globomyces pollinis-pini]